MWGKREEDVGGTQLAADSQFSSLQKFGEAFLSKLRGKKMPNELLERATFAEIPGLLETGSKVADREYPFHDACQWFIDHADLILLVYDYAKLDVGAEAEALLDQLKGRMARVRIVLNKADEISAEEMMKIQGNLVWNISPLMASGAEPPAVYAGSFWSRPYKAGAPKRLLAAQERSLLEDLRSAVDSVVEHRVATARRFAVRARNHAKMVDCYLTTYLAEKSAFGRDNELAEDIVENPDQYHIYDAISALEADVSRYDLPDPESYRKFFAAHPLPDFETLADACGYFRNCPVDALDKAIAYDLPNLLDDYKKNVADIHAAEGKKGKKVKKGKKNKKD